MQGVSCTAGVETEGAREEPRGTWGTWEAGEWQRQAAGCDLHVCRLSTATRTPAHAPQQGGHDARPHPAWQGHRSQLTACLVR